MPDWSAFQTETGDLVRFNRLFNGDEEILDEFQVTCYFEFGNKRIINNENEEVTAIGTVTIDPDARFDPNHRHWKFRFEEHEYNVENIHRVKNIGSNTISHFELQLR